MPVPLTQSRLQAAGAEPGLETTSVVPAPQTVPGLGHAAGVSSHSTRLGGDVRHRAKEPGARSCPRTATLAQNREFCA